jgi:hypothetical protein
MQFSGVTVANCLTSNARSASLSAALGIAAPTANRLEKASRRETGGSAAPPPAPPPKASTTPTHSRFVNDFICGAAGFESIQAILPARR